MSNAPFLPLLLTIIEAVGTLAFALSGLLEAARKRLDAVGVCLVAGLAAFGGGTSVSRDTNRPDVSTESGSSNADDPPSVSAPACACRAARAHSSAVRPDTRTPRNSTPSGIAVT